MHRSLVIAALAAVASTTALAQSNVTVYGRLNASVESVKNGNLKAVTQLVNNSSRIGFRGTEDLGGGLSAGFQIEHGFNVDNGAATNTTNFWARQSEVNLGSSTLGRVRLGTFTSEAYYATADYVSLHNHDTGNSADRLYADTARTTNKVGYRSPSFAGLTVDAAVSLGEAVAGTKRNLDLAANYAVGDLHVGFGYQKGDSTTTKLNQYALSALYTMGPLTFGGYVQRDKNVFFNNGNRTNVRLSGMYALGASEFHLNVGRAGDYSNTPGDTAATQLTLAYNYNLSKRTKLFAFYTKVDDKGTLYGDFRSLALGLRHNF